MRETRVRSLGQEDSPGEENGNPLQYFRLENPMDRGHKESDTTATSLTGPLHVLCLLLGYHSSFFFFCYLPLPSAPSLYGTSSGKPSVNPTFSGHHTPLLFLFGLYSFLHY